MEHLAKKAIKVPAPIPNCEHQLLTTLKNKPATIVTKLKGSSKLKPDSTHCALVGDMLAKMHLAGMDFPMHQPNLRSLPWWQETVPTVLPYLQKQQAELLINELQEQTDFFQSANYSLLPAGPSHCDLFRDNVLFDHVDGEDQLGGFFDFYFAGTDKWLFDLAVTVNDWCIDLSNGQLVSDRYQALTNSYQLVRPLSDAEKKAWPMMLRAAALRFWISRLWDFYLPRDASLLTPHDPTHFERVLQARRNQEFTV
jgi:homoserine kinase type II